MYKGILREFRIVSYTTIPSQKYLGYFRTLQNHPKNIWATFVRYKTILKIFEVLSYATKPPQKKLGYSSTLRKHLQKINIVFVCYVACYFISFLKLVIVKKKRHITNDQLVIFTLQFQQFQDQS